VLARTVVYAIWLGDTQLRGRGGGITNNVMLLALTVKLSNVRLRESHFFKHTHTVSSKLPDDRTTPMSEIPHTFESMSNLNNDRNMP